jgi:hypothetical protein
MALSPVRRDSNARSDFNWRFALIKKQATDSFAAAASLSDHDNLAARR